MGIKEVITELEAGVIDLDRWEIDIHANQNLASIKSGDFYIEYEIIDMDPGMVTIIDNEGIIAEFDASTPPEELTEDERQICLLVSHHVFANGLAHGHLQGDSISSFYEKLRLQIIWGMAENGHPDAKALIFDSFPFPDEPEH